MHLTLKRIAYLRDYTAGLLTVLNQTFSTVERPWIPTPAHRGGTNSFSCVPDGDYKLEPFVGARFQNVYALSNPDLDVYVGLPTGKLGRSAILIHEGNTVKDVIGCIAIGMAASADGSRVSESVQALNFLRSILGKDVHTLSISPKGTT